MGAYSPPPGITTAKINPATGLRDPHGTMTEYFFDEQLPPEAENKIEEALRSVEDVIKEFFSP